MVFLVKVVLLGVQSELEYFLGQNCHRHSLFLFKLVRLLNFEFASELHVFSRREQSRLGRFVLKCFTKPGMLKSEWSWEAFSWIFCQKKMHQVFRFLTNVIVTKHQLLNYFLSTHDLLYQFNRRPSSVEGMPSSQKHDKYYSCRPNINFFRVNTILNQSFWRCKCQSSCCLCIHQHDFSFFCCLSYVEIYNHNSFFVFCNQYIRGLDVPVTNLLFMKVFKPF